MFVCFTRSYDQMHMDTSRIHLISSVLGSNQEYNVLHYNNYSISNDNNIYYIIKIVDSLSNLGLDNSLSTKMEDGFTYNITNINDNLKVLVITLENLIGMLLYNKSPILKEIFGQINEGKDLTTVYNNCLFEFRNEMFWSNIVLQFKLNGIDISGGSISRRHIMSTVNYELISHINKLYNLR